MNPKTEAHFRSWAVSTRDGPVAVDVVADGSVGIHTPGPAGPQFMRVSLEHAQALHRLLSLALRQATDRQAVKTNKKVNEGSHG